MLDSEQATTAKEPEFHLADRGVRFVNYLVDVIVAYVIMFGVMMVFGGAADPATGEGSALASVLGIVAFFAYFFVMEHFVGQTVGKMLTGTRVVTVRGEKPEMMTILGRTAARFIPFEPFSFLFGKYGWHDSLTGTRVVTKRFFEE
jgi:uncharacterized RDD family membrane protein YckC